MNSRTSQDVTTFTPNTKATFLQLLRERPSNRRVSRNDREKIVEWLTSPANRPSSQAEFSRRNYVRRTFTWDESSQSLLAKTQSEEGENRIVITEDMIADTVELVHESNGHRGWDATWKAISTSYYGILRSDVIFLLKNCQICAFDPSKRSKDTKATQKSSYHDGCDTSSGRNLDAMEDDTLIWNAWTVDGSVAD